MALKEDNLREIQGNLEKIMRNLDGKWSFLAWKIKNSEVSSMPKAIAFNAKSWSKFR